MRIRVAAIIIVPLVVAAACGGSTTKQSHTPAATPAPVSAEAFKAAAQKAIDASMIAAGDFPAGWNSSPQNSSNDSDVKFSPPCEIFNSEEDYPNSVASTKSLNFDGQNHEEISSDGAVFATADIAQQEQKKYEDALAQCHDEMVRIFTEIFQRELADQGATGIHVAFDDLPFHAYGDWTHAYRVSFTVDLPRGQVSGKIDSVAMRSARVVGNLTFADFGGLDPRIHDGLADIFADRLAKAEASLPQ